MANRKTLGPEAVRQPSRSPREHRQRQDVGGQRQRWSTGSVWKARASVGRAVDMAVKSRNSIGSALATASGTRLAAKPERWGGASEESYKRCALGRGVG